MNVKDLFLQIISSPLDALLVFRLSTLTLLSYTNQFSHIQQHSYAKWKIVQKPINHPQNI